MTYPTRSLAALAAKRQGLAAFECLLVSPQGAEDAVWIIEGRDRTATLDFAELWAAGRDFVHHIEVTALQVPLIIATCTVAEIQETGVQVPALLKIRPCTPSLWEQQKPQRVKAPVATTEQEKNAVVTMPIPVNDLVANFFSKK